MKLGIFSMSLSVKDLVASKAFYEKLGFEQFGGGMEMNYLIMKDKTTLIGLFQGMFEGNILTFNPGWDDKAQKVDDFEDIRSIQTRFSNNGIDVGDQIETDSGRASFTIKDPDGNVILIDQHV